MSEGIAIIVAAAITVGGMFGSNFLHERSNERQRRKDSKERFFYEIYQRRLALYEDVIKTLNAMGKTEAELFKMSKQEFSDKVFIDFHALLTLSSRLIIYGGPGTREIILTAISEMNVIHETLSKEFNDGIVVLSSATNVTPLKYVIGVFILLVNNALKDFAASISKETGGELVKDKISEILEDIVIVPGKKQSDDNPGGNSN